MELLAATEDLGTCALKLLHHSQCNVHVLCIIVPGVAVAFAPQGQSLNSIEYPCNSTELLLSFSDL